MNAAVSQRQCETSTPPPDTDAPASISVSPSNDQSCRDDHGHDRVDEHVDDDEGARDGRIAQAAEPVHGAAPGIFHRSALGYPGCRAKSEK